ncbi:DNA translocase FtsK 4TM domain-containing protein, partial [Listeria monocytogenes]|uniref:DNA translocase FtsK 4TM domain-containing protein n=1 Tax=Listeria monocytogenes TaxID=1639 RepID=UPI002FDBB951
MLGRLPGRRALGGVLVLLAAATTLAAALPRELRFSSEFYAEAGGLVGSGIYGAVHWAGGTIGAALVLCLLYALGLSLLT